MGEFFIWIPMLIMLGIATYTDLRWRIIPDKLVMVGLVYFLVLRLLYADHPYYNYLLGIAAGAGLLYAFALYCPRAFGGGDIKLMAVVGVGFGWQWTLLILLLTLLAIIVYALGILLMKGRRRRRVIPMAPFFLLIVFLLNYMMM